tara:strand:+ start:154 stop:288 length:135 start_codon:yes stop_codon:yes gene_type:complete
VAVQAALEGVMGLMVLQVVILFFQQSHQQEVVEVDKVVAVVLLE